MHLTPDEINERHGEVIYRCRPCGAEKDLQWYRETSCPVCRRQECHSELDREFEEAMQSALADY